MSKNLPKNSKLTKKRISSLIFQKFLPKGNNMGNNYNYYNLIKNKEKKPKNNKNEIKKINSYQKEKQVFQYSENNNNIELDYLNFSQIDIDLYRNNRSFEDDIFSSTLKLDSNRRKITSIRYADDYTNINSNKNYNDDISIKKTKNDEDETDKTTSTICNYYNKSQNTHLQKEEIKNNNKIKNNNIKNSIKSNKNINIKQKRESHIIKNIKDIFLIGFKNNEFIDRIRSSTFENIKTDNNKNNKKINKKYIKKQNKNNKKNNNEFKSNIPFKNNLINDYMRNKLKLNTHKNKIGINYNQNNKKIFLKEKLKPLNKVNLTSFNNTNIKTEDNNSSLKKKSITLLINKNKNKHGIPSNLKNENSNSKKSLKIKIDSMINNKYINKKVKKHTIKYSSNNLSYKNFKLQPILNNTLEKTSNKRNNSYKISNNIQNSNNSLNSFNNLKYNLIKTLTRPSLPIRIKKPFLKKKLNSKSSKGKNEYLNFVPNNIKSKRKNSFGVFVINKIYTNKNKTSFKQKKYVFRKTILPKKKFNFYKLQITPRNKIPEKIKGLTSMNKVKKLFVDLSQKNECNTENKNIIIKKSNSIKKPAINTDWKKNKFYKNKTNNSNNLKIYKLFNTLNNWKNGNEKEVIQKTDIAEYSTNDKNAILNKINLISSDESDKENDIEKNNNNK